MNKKCRPTLQDLARPRTLVRTYGWTKTYAPTKKIVEILSEHKSPIAIHVDEVKKYLDNWCKKSFVGDYRIPGGRSRFHNPTFPINLLIEKEEDFVYYCLYWGITQ